MKFRSTTRLFLWLLPLLLLSGSCALRQHFTRGAPYTTVYVARHAEKDLTPGLADPALTPAGQQRALALRDAIGKNQWVGAVFTTNTSRTRATAAPLAEAHKLPVEVYDAGQLRVLAARIRGRFTGQVVLVVGHSNTILETIEALGASRPVPTIQGDEYDYLLEVRVPRDSTRTPTAVARRYGARSSGQ
ncbi:MAG: histidine phosphatase family protein [Hymenobacter sp.]|nr:histidine phosphatase family protein [Hymenobacter sp.]